MEKLCCSDNTGTRSTALHQIHKIPVKKNCALKATNDRLKKNSEAEWTKDKFPGDYIQEVCYINLGFSQGSISKFDQLNFIHK